VTATRRRTGVRWLPHPWLAAWLLAGWLLLNQTTAPGHVLLGGLLAIVIARAMPPAPSHAARRGARGLRRAAVALRLCAVVLRDVVVANVQVATRILGPQARLRPGFVWVPLAAQRPVSITLLAGIVTMTPGTVSAEVTQDRRHLLVHGLDIADAEALVAEIRQRYETPIMELLE